MAISGRQGAGQIPAVATAYKGTIFRSALEASWARTLDQYEIGWQYEPRLIRLPSGARYLPDFWLPALRTYLEVKGAHMQRAGKPGELAADVAAGGTIVLIGFGPERRHVAIADPSPLLVWRDALGYDTRLTRCAECGAYQWVRAAISRTCRLCESPLTGLLAKSGEMPFAEPDELTAVAITPAFLRIPPTGESC